MTDLLIESPAHRVPNGFQRFPCASLGQGCVRPRSVYFFKLRGTGGKGFGEGVLNHLFTREQITVAEGWSLSHAPTAAKLRAMEGAGGAIRVTILRHPIKRIVSRYWFEGRWPLFHRGELTEESAMSFGAWFNKTLCGPSDDRRGGRLWQCSSNYYVKSLSGWAGKDMCAKGGSGCVGGVGEAQLGLAKAALRGRMDVVLLTEWLSARPQAALLARFLCFAHDGAGRTPTLSHPGMAGREVPNFRPVSPAGGHSKLRPPQGAGWALSSGELEALRVSNRLDMALFRWAEGALVRPRIEEEWRRSSSSSSSSSSGGGGSSGGKAKSLSELLPVTSALKQLLPPSPRDDEY